MVTYVGMNEQITRLKENASVRKTCYSMTSIEIQNKPLVVSTETVAYGSRKYENNQS